MIDITTRSYQKNGDFPVLWPMIRVYRIHIPSVSYEIPYVYLPSNYQFLRLALKQKEMTDATSAHVGRHPSHHILSQLFLDSVRICMTQNDRGTCCNMLHFIIIQHHFCSYHLRRCPKSWKIAPCIIAVIKSSQMCQISYPKCSKHIEAPMVIEYSLIH